jgi:uncharacterized protein YbbC (DUF1343 family)/CubicO group peptidase (beta-lactamase class C family)
MQLPRRGRTHALTRALALGVPIVALLLATPCANGADFNEATRAQLEHIVTEQINAGRLPGAVIIAGNAQHVLYRAAFGQRALEPHPEPMTADTVFDLASLTKVVATTTSVMQLSEQGRLQLDAPVARYWPAFAANGKAAVTVRNLLTHTSGLPPDLPLPPAGQGRTRLLRDAALARLVAPPGERVIYSDINFIVLGELVQRVTHRPLDAYCRTRIFMPLGMRDTMFVPDAQRAARSAATTADRAGMRVGRVHDPVAARMGGVAGHAGLFSTADDLAHFAQMILNEGRSQTVRVLQPASIAALATPGSPLTQLPWRGIGWELDAPLVADRDRLPPLGMIGHTGYTGTGIWIDLASRHFIVVLTNRVHPDDRGDARALRTQILALLASRAPPMTSSDLGHLFPWAQTAIGKANQLPTSTGPVSAGIDVLEDEQFRSLAGLRVGLVTNRTGLDAHGRRTVDVLLHAPGVRLVALFSPEHGLGTDQDERTGDTRDAATGLLVHSLYGDHRRFSPQAMAGLDALVFDLQDAGVRFFTYETTLGYALEAAATSGIALFVLDRPNPLGADRFGGPSLDAGHESFTGYFPLPLLPGMTVGELAALFNQERNIHADLRVIPMRDYRRSMRFSDTGRGWVPLSPNLRTPAQLDLYPDTALLEGSNISVGRGTPHPFESLGAPWVDANQLAAALNAAQTDARFEPIDFVPTESTWRGVLCHGVHVVTADANRQPARLGLTMLAVMHRLYPDAFDFAATHDAIGSNAMWESLLQSSDATAAISIATADATRFAALRARYLRY